MSRTTYLILSSIIIIISTSINYAIVAKYGYDGDTASRSYQSNTGGFIGGFNGFGGSGGHK